MAKLDDILNVLAHPARRDALRLIDRNREVCLCEILAEVDVPQPNMSRHMAMLLRSGLVVDRRDGRRVLYRRNTPLSGDIIRLVDAVLSVSEDPVATGTSKEMAA